MILIVVIWSAALVSALVLRGGIRWHLHRWLLSSIRRAPDALRSRRLLFDPLIPITPSRRLFT
jgi:hypothetical protein